jgi:hypothetical protein
MSYSTGEALILTRVQACTGFTSSNTSRADWKVLNSGRSDHYAILRPGSFSLEWQTLSMAVISYTTVIEVWQQYVDDATSYTNLYGYVNNLYNILQYPHLGGLIQDSTITGAPEVEQMWRQEGGPAWLRWSVSISWQEEQAVTFAE